MQSVIDDLFYSIYQYLGFGIVFAAISILAFPEIKRRGAIGCLLQIWKEMQSDTRCKYRFLFFVYLFMVLSRTLICRNIWECPWENIIGEWGLFTAEGSFNTEGTLNVLLFFPLTFFALMGFPFKGAETLTAKKIVIRVTKLSFAFSSGIEICQLFFRLGTFQLSDIVQNTLGGIIGAVLYILVDKIKHKSK